MSQTKADDVRCGEVRWANWCFKETRCCQSKGEQVSSSVFKSQCCLPSASAASCWLDGVVDEDDEEDDEEGKDFSQEAALDSSTVTTS